jgi:hypothetical protein
MPITRPSATERERTMPESNTAKRLTLPNAGQGALSIRAKALIFHDKEAWRFAKLVFPLLPGKAPVTVQDQVITGGPFDQSTVRTPAAMKAAA